MTRIVVKNSVDQRLLTMQLHKLQGIEKVRILSCFSLMELRGGGFPCRRCTSRAECPF